MGIKTFFELCLFRTHWFQTHDAKSQRHWQGWQTERTPRGQDSPSQWSVTQHPGKFGFVHRSQVSLACPLPPVCLSNHAQVYTFPPIGSPNHGRQSWFLIRAATTRFSNSPRVCRMGKHGPLTEGFQPRAATPPGTCTVPPVIPDSLTGMCSSLSHAIGFGV